MSDIDYKNSLERFRNLGDEYYKEGRAMFLDVSNHLMTISVFMLGFIGIWLNLNTNGEHYELKKFFIFGIIFLTASLFFGIWSKFENNKFFNKWGDFYFTIHKKLYFYMKDTKKEFGEVLPEYLWKSEEDVMNRSFFSWQFKTQIILFGFCIVAFIFVLIGL